MFAFSNRHAYHDTVVSLPYTGNSRVAISVHDRRHYVTDGSKHPNFVGSMRSGVGIPYDISTKTKLALAEDMLGSLAASFGRKGFQVEKANASHTESPETVLGRLHGQSADRKIIMTLYEWKTDTYMNADLFCFVTLQVFDAGNNLLGESSIKAEREGYGGSFWNPVKHARRVAPKAFKLKMDALFGHENIRKAF